MTAGSDRGGTSCDKADLAEIGALAFVIISYIGILFALRQIPGERGFQATLWVPNAWLLACGAVWAALKRPDFRIAVARGQSAWLQAAIVLAVCVAWIWVASALRASTRSVTQNEAVQLRFQQLTLLVPAAEELYFRGFLLHGLKKSLGWQTALALSSGLFAFLHFPQGTAIPMAGLGLVAGAVTLASRSLWSAVVIHMAWNAIALRMEAGPIAHFLGMDIFVVLLVVPISAVFLLLGLRKQNELRPGASREEAGPA